MTLNLTMAENATESEVCFRLSQKLSEGQLENNGFASTLHEPSDLGSETNKIGEINKNKPINVYDAVC